MRSSPASCTPSPPIATGAHGCLSLSTLHRVCTSPSWCSGSCWGWLRACSNDAASREPTSLRTVLPIAVLPQRADRDHRAQLPERRVWRPRRVPGHSVAIERRKRMNHLLSIKKLKFMAISMTIMLALVILLSTSGSATGQENGVAPGRNGSTAQPPQQQGPTDHAELEAFLDKELGREMEKHHIAGAAVSVVKDGKLFLPKVTAPSILRTKSQWTPNGRTFALGHLRSCSPGRR